MTKKSTMDTYLTIYNRFYSIEGMEALVARDERKRGQASFWNSHSRIQEIINRGSKPDHIAWLAYAIGDALECGTAVNDLSGSVLRSGPKSVTDVMITAFSCKKYLLGSWLDSKDFPSYVKAKVREIFSSHASFRKMWNPHNDDAAVDTSWLFTWPPVATKLLYFSQNLQSICKLQMRSMHTAKLLSTT